MSAKNTGLLLPRYLLELAPPEQYCDNLSPWRLSVLPVVPEQWVLQPKPKTIKQFKVLQALLKKANQVVIATDADREGDVIGREVLAYCQYEGSIQRLWLSALDEASIRKGLASLQPNESTYSLYLSGLGRQRADWLIGMNMTMATTALFGVPGGVLPLYNVGYITAGTPKSLTFSQN